MKEPDEDKIMDNIKLFACVGFFVFMVVTAIVAQTMPHTKVDHTAYIKNYKYETLKTTNDAHATPTYKLKIYKQDGMKDDIPQWKYVKTVDYGEKKPNM